ncbi:MAG: hypothetical protein J2P21_23610 [Chloracidobacterium sp.]|nr:hypothetical protein [Chloracidobacterium sp.]
MNRLPLLLAFLIATLAHSAVYACSCAATSPPAEFNRAKAIFIRKALGGTESWEKKTKDSIPNQFEAGKERPVRYIIYGYDDADGNGLHGGSCTGTRRANDKYAKEDLDFLRNHRKRTLHMTKQRISPENSDLRIAATLESAIVRRGEGATVVMTMVHRGTDLLYVPHPMGATEALALDICLPSGNSLLVRYPRRIPGVPPRVVNAGLPPGIKAKFEIYLDSVLPLDMAGIYSLRVEYPWKVGETWRSPWLTFTVRHGPTSVATSILDKVHDTLKTKEPGWNLTKIESKGSRTTYQWERRQSVGPNDGPGGGNANISIFTTGSQEEASATLQRMRRVHVGPIAQLENLGDEAHIESSGIIRFRKGNFVIVVFATKSIAEKLSAYAAEAIHFASGGD